MAQNGSNRLTLVQTCSNCFKLGQTSSNWLKLVLTGLNWFKLVQTGSNLFKLVPTGSNWFKLVQIGLNWLEMVQTGSVINGATPFSWLVLKFLLSLNNIWAPFITCLGWQERGKTVSLLYSFLCPDEVCIIFTPGEFSEARIVLRAPAAPHFTAAPHCTGAPHCTAAPLLHYPILLHYTVLLHHTILLPNPCCNTMYTVHVQICSGM